MDYSQHGEQGIIAKHVPERGFFVDLGANDGVTYSNTYALKQRGWRGLYVEPQAVNVAALKASIPDAVVAEVCVGTEDKTVKFWERSGGKHMVSTMVEGELRRWPSLDFHEATAESVTVATLLRRYRIDHIDFLSIDVEGVDLEVLVQFDLSALGVCCLCIEHNGKSERLGAMALHANKHGMALTWANGCNAIFTALRSAHK